jgi:hypothetical protein
MQKTPVLSIGVINPNTGKTMYDWGIYDEPWATSKMAATLVSGGSLIFGAGEPEEIRKQFELVGNDSGRRLRDVTVIDSCELSKENLLAMLKRNGYDYTPIKAFKKRPEGNRKLSTCYVFK